MSFKEKDIINVRINNGCLTRIHMWSQLHYNGSLPEPRGRYYTCSIPHYTFLSFFSFRPFNSRFLLRELLEIGNRLNNYLLVHFSVLGHSQCLIKTFRYRANFCFLKFHLTFLKLKLQFRFNEFSLNSHNLGLHKLFDRPSITTAILHLIFSNLLRHF